MRHETWKHLTTSTKRVCIIFCCHSNNWVTAESIFVQWRKTQTVMKNLIYRYYIQKCNDLSYQILVITLKKEGQTSQYSHLQTKWQKAKSLRHEWTPNSSWQLTTWAIVHHSVRFQSLYEQRQKCQILIFVVV